jgi:putative phage-type endonuclease
MSIKMIILKNRDEWLKNRMNGIGGSEISAVIGENPYMDNVTLWEIKTGRRIPDDISDKPFVEYGHSAEHYLRELFKLDFPQYRVEYVDNNSWRNDRYPWALASLDGWLTDEQGRKGILEIKTTEILSSMHKEKWKGNNIPMNYYCQCLFYMGVTEAEFCVLKAQLKTVFDGVPYLQTKHYTIERKDVQADIDYLMREGERFWEYVKNDTRPPLTLPSV